jgi:3-isopropylmalate/(R)-2-methylmalate dehydratase small subunit
VSFEGLETHAFEDDRKQLAERGQVHAFSNPKYQGASVLIVNGNFGCGSSREHAPQALQRWGIRAVIGESFSEIFFGNSVALGMPCLTVSAADAEALLSAVEANPQLELTISVAAETVEAGGTRYKAAVPAGAREALTTGSWDATGALLDHFEQVRNVAAHLPYIAGY